MKIGELLISLGITGGDKAKKEVSGLKDAMKETKSVSLEAKAAILGAMYALQRLFANSSQAGTDLMNFNSQVGVSTQTLQQYQHAARQVGLSNQEVAGTFKSLQNAMVKTLTGKGPPEFIAQVAMKTGIKNTDIEKFAKEPQLLLQKLQEYAQKETNAGLKNEVLKSFGLSDGMIAALSRNAFRPEVLAQAPTYSDREIQSLDKANAAWSNLGTKIEMAIGRFNAKHGGDIVQDISKMTDAVIRLAEALVLLSEKFKLFEKLQAITDKTAQTIGALALMGDDKATGADVAKQLGENPAEFKDATKTEVVARKTADAFIGEQFLRFIADALILGQKLKDSGAEPPTRGMVPNSAAGSQLPANRTSNTSPQSPTNRIPNNAQPYKYERLPGVLDIKVRQPAALPEGPKMLSPAPSTPKSEKSKTPVVPNIPGAKDAVPKVPAQAANAGNSVTITNEFDQTFNFDNTGGDPKAIGNETKRAVQGAFRQSFAQSQWS